MTDVAMPSASGSERVRDFSFYQIMEDVYIY